MKHFQIPFLSHSLCLRVELSIKTVHLECMYAFTYFSSERVKVVVLYV